MSLIVLILVGGALGACALRPIQAKGPEALAYRLYAGLSLAAILIVVIGSISLHATNLTLIAAALVAAVWLAITLKRRAANSLAWPSPTPKLNRLEIACLIAIIAANAIALISALAPNTNWDAGVAHLALPSDYARDGAIGLREGNVYSAYPHLLHSLYTFLYYGSGETAVTLLSWLFGPLACLALFALGKRVESRECGFIAAAILATSPIYFDQVGTASIDVPFAGVAAASLCCLYAWHDERRPRWLLLAAFLAGSACGIRHTGYLVSFLMTVGILFVSPERRVKHALLFAGVAALAAGPWMLRSALLVGNPLYPFLSGLFPVHGLLTVPTTNTALAEHTSIQASGLLDLLRFPWDLIMHPDRYDGWAKSPGGLVLLLGPPGFFLGARKARLLGAFSIAGGVVFFYFQRLARYMLPFFTPMMVLAGVAACRLERLRRPIAALLIFTFIFGLTLGAASVSFKVPAALRLESREDYLTRRVERYTAFQWVNENLPKDATVLTFDPRGYFIDRPTYQNFEILQVLRPLPIAEQANWLIDRGIDYVFYPVAYFDESPSFRENGYIDDLARWQAAPEFFELSVRG